MLSCIPGLVEIDTEFSKNVQNVKAIVQKLLKQTFFICHVSLGLDAFVHMDINSHDIFNKYHTENLTENIQETNIHTLQNHLKI